MYPVRVCPLWCVAALCTCCSSLSLAADHSLPGKLDTCPALITEAECRAHHLILQALPEGRERQAYLAMQAQLLEEREAACGCTKTNHSVGLAYTP